MIDLKFYLSLFLRRLHYFLIVLTLGSVIGLTLAWMPVSYTHLDVYKRQ